MVHRCYVTHLECSGTGERQEAGRAHTLSRAGKPLLAPYDLEAIGRDVAVTTMTPSTVVLIG